MCEIDPVQFGVQLAPLFIGLVNLVFVCLKDQHNENLDKLNYVLKLCEYIIDLAKSRTSPFSTQTNPIVTANYQTQTSTSPPTSNNGGQLLLNAAGNNDRFTAADETMKKAEQLILYLKALQLLKPVLLYAKDELKLKRLSKTQKVCKYIKQLNNIYKYCLYQCKQLYTIDPSLRNKDMHNIYLNADKLLYIHAIELCREAALGEFFGKPYNVCAPFLCQSRMNEKRYRVDILHE